MVKSIRGNSVPSGGAAVTMDSGQAQTVLPSTLQMTQISEMFKIQSEHNCTMQDTQTLTPGQTKNFKVNNVGLGESLELLVEGAISLVNAATSSQQVNLSFDFPFSLISNETVQFNGSTVLHSMSGYENLAIMAKRGKRVLTNEVVSGASGSYFQQAKARVDNAIASITAGANVVLNAGNNLCGVDYVTVSASSTGVVNFKFYVEIPFTMSKANLLGLLPMQNNSVYLNIGLTTPTLIGTTQESPLYVASAVPATLTNSSTITVKPCYNFWAVPNPNDPSIYNFLCSHNYLLNSQGGNVQAATGAGSFKYNLANNCYLLALLLTMRDSTGAFVDIPATLNNACLSYNGTALVDKAEQRIRDARDRIYRLGVHSALGQFMQDFTDVDFLPNGVNSSKWLDMYQANNPQWIADVAAGFSTSGTYAVLREQLVPATVQTV